MSDNLKKLAKQALTDYFLKSHEEAAKVLSMEFDEMRRYPDRIGKEVDE